MEYNYNKSNLNKETNPQLRAPTKTKIIAILYIIYMDNTSLVI